MTYATGSLNQRKFFTQGSKLTVFIKRGGQSILDGAADANADSR